MGYYSDIRLVTTKKGWEYLEKRMKECAEKVALTPRLEDFTYNMMDPDVFYTNRNRVYVVYVGWNDRKWYRHDTPVIQFERYLEEMGEPYHLAVAGEDGDLSFSKNDPECELPQPYTRTVFEDEQYAMDFGLKESSYDRGEMPREEE